MTILSRRERVSIGSSTARIVFFVAVGYQCLALSIAPPPSQTLPDLGFGTDKQSVSSYLEYGIPNTITPKRKENNRFLNEPYNRWQLYESIVGLVVELHYSELAPHVAKLLLDPLPQGIDFDLDKVAATYNNIPENISWDQWDKFREERLLAFRTLVANNLGELQNPAVIPVLSQRLAVVNAVYLAKPSRELLYHIIALCKSQARLGDTSGVDGLIELMPGVSDAELSSCEHALMHATGHRFVRSARNETRTRDERISQWHEWWETHRSEFDSSKARENTKAWAKEPVPQPQTLQEILQAASNNFFPHYREARTWLDTNGPKIVRELRAIAASSDEDSWARSLASAEYAKYGGRSAKRWLRKLALAPSNPSVDNNAMNSPCNPFPLLKEIDEEETQEIAKQCIAKRGLRAPLAIQSLTASRSNIDYLAQVYLDYRDNYDIQFSLIQSLSSLGYNKPDIYEAALAQNDRYLSTFAYRSILMLGLENSLNEESAKRLAAWKQDSVFLVALAESLRDSSRTKDIKWQPYIDDAMRLANSDDAVSTVTHYRISRFYNYAGDEYASSAHIEYEKFLSGVTKYRASRGRASVENAS